MPARTESQDAVLAKLRKIVLALPGTYETRSWGHPNFRAGGPIFCAFEEKRGVPCIFRGDPRVLNSSHTGRDWVDIRVDQPVDWTLVRELAQESHGRFFVSAKPAAKKRPARRRASRRR